MSTIAVLLIVHMLGIETLSGDQVEVTEGVPVKYTFSQKKESDLRVVVVSNKKCGFPLARVPFFWV